MPSVSVIIPTYNYAEYVGTAIESALQQTYTDREVIVVDDGSTDDTGAVLDRFASRIQVIRQPNRGLSAARNAGIGAATGAYVALLDADDAWERPYLEHAAARLAAAEESVIGVCAGWVMIDRSGVVLPHTQQIRHGTLGLRDFLYRAPFPPSTVTLRRAAVGAAGGFDEALQASEDWDLWLRLTAAGGRFVALERCLCRYRVHGRNMSHNPDPMRAAGLRTLEKLFANPALPAELRAARAAAFAHVHARASSQLYAAGRAEDGARALDEAARLWPEILLEDETFWAVICAAQPVGYKGTAQFIDLARGESDVFGALARCIDGGVFPSGAARRQAEGRALRALAALAYAQRNMPAARRYAVRALLAHPPFWLDSQTIATFVKSLAGRRAIETLSRWKRLYAPRQ